jgi:hypothetical protein
MQLNEALKRVEAFLKGVRLTDDRPNLLSSLKSFHDNDLGGMVLGGDELVGFNRCVDAVSSAIQGNDTFSRRGVERLLEKALLLAWGKEEGITQFPQQRINGAIDKLKLALRATPSTYFVYLPVVGLAPECLPVGFGRLRFLPNDPYLVEIKQAVTDFVTSMKPREGMDPEVAAANRLAHAKGFTDKIDAIYSNSTIAELEVQAGDEVHARDKGLRECRRTLDAINFFSDIFETEGTKACVSLLGEGQQAVQLVREEDRERRLLMFREQGDADKAFMDYHGRRIVVFHTMPYARVPLRGLELPGLDSPRAQQSGYARLSELLVNVGRNGLDDRVLAAIQWAGRGTVDSRPEEAFLLYAIALESLVLGKQNQPELAFRFRTMTAHLLRETLPDRRQLVKRLTDLYGIRSKIVHTGSFQVTANDVREIRRYTKEACRTVLTDERFAGMRSEQEFDGWLFDQLLG